MAPETNVILFDRRRLQRHRVSVPKVISPWYRRALWSCWQACKTGLRRFFTFLLLVPGVMILGVTRQLGRLVHFVCCLVGGAAICMGIFYATLAWLVPQLTHKPLAATVIPNLWRFELEMVAVCLMTIGIELALCLGGGWLVEKMMLKIKPIVVWGLH